MDLTVENAEKLNLEKYDLSVYNLITTFTASRTCPTTELSKNRKGLNISTFQQLFNHTKCQVTDKRIIVAIRSPLHHSTIKKRVPHQLLCE